MFIKDWKECSQNLIPLELDKDRFYYLQAQAWHIKGYLGGTHSYCAFFHDSNWLVVELTDIETLEVQNAEIVYSGASGAEHAPFITKRPYNAEWFGKSPYIVDSCPKPLYNDIVIACKNYPLQEFKILSTNCNTFTSYLIAALNLNLRRPIRSVGFKNSNWWRKKHNV